MADSHENNSLLIDIQSFPSITYYLTLVKHEILELEQYEHFKKGSYANRYYLAGPNGKILLSIPLLHTQRERMAFKDLKICNRDHWQRLHWRTLTSAYRRSPWFEYYEDALQPLYDKKFEYLVDWNLQAFELVNSWLGLSWEISFTDEYHKQPPLPGMEDARHRITPGNPLPDFPRYQQVFEDRTGFLPGLSILDLIFCQGKNAVSYLH